MLKSIDIFTERLVDNSIINKYQAEEILRYYDTFTKSYKKKLINAIENVFGILWSDVVLIKKSKIKNPQQMYCYFCNLDLNDKNESIGIDINKHRTTVYSSIKTITDRLHVKDEFTVNIVNKIKDSLKEINLDEIKT